MCIRDSNNIQPVNGALLLDEEICIAVPHSHRLAGKTAVDLGELRDDSFISLDIGKQLRMLTDTFCRAVGFSPNIVFECDNPALVRSLIAAELGVAFVPKMCIRDRYCTAGPACADAAPPDGRQ